MPRPKSDPFTRKVMHDLHRKHQLNHSFAPFTLTLTTDAINVSSSLTATGPDGLTSLNLKHLGPAGVAYPTAIYKLSVRDAVIPAI